MNENWLDKELKDKFANYDSPMDLEGAWNALETKRDEKKKKRFFLFYWLFPVLIVGLIGYQFIIQETVESEELLVQNTETQKITQGDKKAHSLDTKSTQNVVEANSSLADEKKKIQHNSKSNSSISNLVNTTKSNLVNTIKSNISYTRNSTVYPENTNTTFSNESDFSSENQSIKKIVSNREIALNNTRSELRNTSLVRAELQFLEISDNRISYIEEADLALSSKSSVSSKLAKKIAHPKPTPQFSFGIGYGYMSKGRVVAEASPLDMVSSNMLYQRYLTQQIYFKTGINLDYYTTTISSSLPINYTQSLENQVVAINHYQDGTAENITGMGDVEFFHTHRYRIYNHYQFVSIPLMLGINLSPMKKNQFELEGGFSSTIFSRFDVKDISPGELTRILPVQNIDLRKSGIIHGLYAIQWNYQPFKSPKVAFFLKYQGQFQLNELTNSSVINMEKFAVHQCMIGVRGNL